MKTNKQTTKKKQANKQIKIKTCKRQKLLSFQHNKICTMTRIILWMLNDVLTSSLLSPRKNSTFRDSDEKWSNIFTACLTTFYYHAWRGLRISCRLFNVICYYFWIYFLQYWFFNGFYSQLFSICWNIVIRSKPKIGFIFYDHGWDIKIGGLQ